MERMHPKHMRDKKISLKGCSQDGGTGRDDGRGLLMGRHIPLSHMHTNENTHKSHTRTVVLLLGKREDGEEGVKDISAVLNTDAGISFSLPLGASQYAFLFISSRLLLCFNMSSFGKYQNNFSFNSF